MFSISAPVSISINPSFNPYWHFAGPGGDYTDPGWKIFFVGGSGSNRFRGDDFADTMWGYGGNDVLEGAGGADDLYGGADDDVLNGGLGADDLYGGSGIDTATYEDAAARVNVNLSIGLGFGGEAWGDTYHSIENVRGSDHDDLIVGNSAIGGNTLEGGQGNDRIYAEGGDDLIRGGAGNDLMAGGAGTDTFEWTQYTPNFVGADRIVDFDVDAELLRFRFDNPATASWTASEEVYEGTEGLMVVLNEAQSNGPFARYDVFLDNVTLAEFDADNIEFF